MAKFQHYQLRTAHQQTGATLVVVLLLLVVLAAISVMVVKQSNSSLKIAAAAQVDNVLFHANDKAFLRFENHAKSASTSYSSSSLLNYLVNNMKLGESLIFCVDSAQLSFDVNNATHQTVDGGFYAGKDNGYCNLHNPNDYNSLGKVITQLSFVLSQPLTKLNNSEQPKNLPTACMANVTGIATSLVPAMSSINQTQILQCFRHANVNMHIDKVASCLKNAGAVVSTHRQDYQLLVSTSQPNCLGAIDNIFINPTSWVDY